MISAAVKVKVRRLVFHNLLSGKRKVYCKILVPGWMADGLRFLVFTMKLLLRMSLNILVKLVYVDEQLV